MAAISDTTTQEQNKIIQTQQLAQMLHYICKEFRNSTLPYSPKKQRKPKTYDTINFEEMSINWQISGKQLHIAIIFKENDLKMFELLENLRNKGCIKSILGSNLPQTVQTMSGYVALCYSTDGKKIPYWDKEKLREQFIKQNTHTTKEKVYSVVCKKAFEQKIERMLPKTFDITKMRGETYLDIPLFINNTAVKAPQSEIQYQTR